jgi:DNA (cytosine-5)-methyltransferase 1
VKFEFDPQKSAINKAKHAFHGLRQLDKLAWYNKYFREEISRETLFQRFPEIADDIEASVIEKKFGERRYIDIICAIRNALKLQGVDKVNVLLGGPPCQAYSLVGRSRDPNRMENDGRHFLYEHYLCVLEDLKPDFLSWKTFRVC